jgi:ribose-phosphate pyrophosphokinase
MVDQMLEDYVICYPDKGAQQRYNYNCSRYICCEKQRDVETGKLLKFSISESKIGPYSDKIVVVDDLCDGGGTFLGIAELLKNTFNPEKLALIITHAVQLEGLKRVAEVYDHVYITNSYCDWNTNESLPKNVTVIEI